MSIEKSLENNGLWTKFTTTTNHKDIAAVIMACENASEALKRVPDTFPTYTLHDATHSINVCNRMEDLLGDDINMLTYLEAAFLILAAFYHDIGMVYAPEEKEQLIQSDAFKAFQNRYPYTSLKISQSGGEVPDDIIEWFLRDSHPGRVPNLQELNLDTLAVGNTLVKNKLIAICKSHGESVDSLLANKTLNAGNTGELDLVFCAMLLRLADILDFDYTRAPEVLYEYLHLMDSDTRRLKISNDEFKKHKSALGFDFSTKGKLFFHALCTEIKVEHDIRSFLEVIELELKSCAVITPKCDNRWRGFNMPTSIDRSGIESRGYKYGHYFFSLDPDQAIKLFVGENLYIDRTVFVRELMQNAIDTVRHYQKTVAWDMREDYKPRIDVTTWRDGEGYMWFRVDDNGMGMDEHKILNYFLKVGNSYYNSDAFLAEQGQFKARNGYMKDMSAFKPIGRFGIGVLSCLLIGDRVELCTRHAGASQKTLRLSLTEGVKYFKLQSEGENYNLDAMPTPGLAVSAQRSAHGTSIAVRIDPYRYVARLNFEELLRKWLLFPPVLVYLNGTQFIWTDEEFLKQVDKAEPVMFKVSRNVIDEVHEKLGIELSSDTYFKVGAFNIDKYVTDVNRGLLRGAALIVYTNIKFADVHKRLSVGVSSEAGRLVFRVFENGICDSNNKFDIGDLGDVPWYHSQLGLFFNDSQGHEHLSLSHNGIQFSEDPFGNRWNSGCYPLCNFLILFSDTFQPVLNLGRDRLISMPLEMCSETVLAIKKSELNLVTTKNRAEDTNDVFESFGSYKAKFTTASEIYKLQNLDGHIGWYGYFKCSEWSIGDIFFALDYDEGEHNPLHPKPFTQMVYFALRQRYCCIEAKDIKGDCEETYCVLEVIGGEVEHNSNIENYYPPLFFIPYLKSYDLVIIFRKKRYGSYTDRLFLNRNHPTSEQLIKYTPQLHDRYPALFRGLIEAVIFCREIECREIITIIEQLFPTLAQSSAL